MSKAEQPVHHADHQHAHVHRQTRDSASVTDPVCGMTITPGELHAEYAGKTYYFCNPKCLAKFLAEPQRYVQPEKKPSPIAPAGGTKWTCPMHPEIVRDAP